MFTFWPGFSYSRCHWGQSPQLFGKVIANCVEVWDTQHSDQNIPANMKAALVRVCHGHLHYCIWVGIKMWHSHASSLALYTLLPNQFHAQAQVIPQMSAPHHLERLFFLGLGHFPLISSTWSLTPDQCDLGGPWTCWQRSRAKAAVVRVNHKLDRL